MTAEAAFRRIAQHFSESYEERTRKIVEAIVALGVLDFYIVDAGEDYAVICTWAEGGEKYWRYDVSWDADGKAIVSNPKEVRPAYVAVDDEAEAEVAEENFRLQQKVATLEASLAKMKAQPAARPAHEEAQSPAAVKTGIARLDRLAEKLGR